jgi:hypothetical protein
VSPTSTPMRAPVPAGAPRAPARVDGVRLRLWRHRCGSLGQAASRALLQGPARCRSPAICSMAAVKTITRSVNGWRIATSRGDIEADDVVIPTNGYTGDATLARPLAREPHDVEPSWKSWACVLPAISLMTAQKLATSPPGRSLLSGIMAQTLWGPTSQALRPGALLVGGCLNSGMGRTLGRLQRPGPAIPNGASDMLQNISQTGSSVLPRHNA